MDTTTDHDSFRNELASVRRDGRRRWIFARQPAGRLYRARTVLSVFLLGFLFFAPFIQVHGQPLMLLNVLERKFVILGAVFRPQDFYLVVVLALGVLVTLVLSTVVIGRVWCGWVCPQTIFMEMVFRRLEYLIEGSAEHQVRLARGPWTRERVVRAAIKHAVFFALSFVIANVFLAWIIGAPDLLAIVTDPPAHHLTGLVAITIFSFVFYAVFARFREQACVLACPYGRVLSSLVDERTVTVTYDAVRGEPRARLVAGAARAGRGLKTPPHLNGDAGDCIDCFRCVTVCPTGIDIRNGIQMECVGCTACIDACNDVMRRIGRPEGLIRHTSADALRPASAGRFSGRVAAYAAVWLVLAGAGVFLLATRPALDVVILRQPGTLYATLEGGAVSNFYTVEALNRSGDPAAFTIDVVEPRGATVTTLGPSPEVPAYGVLDARLLLRLPEDSMTGPSTAVKFAVRSNGRIVQHIDSAFLGPAESPEREHR
jgi:cytochrome c oxidase accessory protein FixG